MIENTKQELIRLLNEIAEKIHLNPIRNYSDLSQNVLQHELQQEIEAIRKMLLKPETFEEEFKKRCRWRETDQKQTIPFNDLPESITNQLYWDIAHVVFKPKNLKEMLQIVLPGITSEIEISISEPKFIAIDGESQKDLKKRMKEFLKKQKDSQGNEIPVLLSRSLDDLTKVAPTVEELSHYVISGNAILNVKKISAFALGTHSNLYQQLNISSTNFAKKLYTHNFNLQTLASDINLYINEGLAPKIPIEQLIRRLIAGGVGMTGNEIASKSATEAVAQFFDYVDELPEEIRNNLRSLKWNQNKTLGDIIDNEIQKGECVEETAKHLKDLLQNNSNSTVLNTPPKMTEEQLNRLKDKYQKVSLDTKKEKSIHHVLPEELVKKAIQNIEPDNAEALIDILLNFSPNYYDTLFEHMTLYSENSDYLDNLASCIKNDFFNQEQKQALAKAITKHYKRFASESVLLWAVKTNEPLFIEEALSSFPTNKLKTVQHAVTTNGDTVLHNAADHPKSLEFILDIYPKNQRLTAIKQVNIEGHTVLHKARNPQSQKLILDLYPQSQKSGAIHALDKNGASVLHHAAGNYESLKFILEFFPTNKNKLKAIKTKTAKGQTVLRFSSPESLKLCLDLIPMDKRLDAIQNDDLFNYFRLSPEGLSILLESLSENEKLDLIELNIFYINELARKNPRSLKAILDCRPANQRMDMLKMTDNMYGNTVLHNANENPEALKIIDECLSGDQKNEARELIEEYNNYLSLLKCKNPESLLEKIESFPENQRLNAIKLGNKRGETILHLNSDNSALMDCILSLLPENQKLDAIWLMPPPGEGNFGIIDFFKSEKASELLKLIPEHQKVEIERRKRELGIPDGFNSQLESFNQMRQKWDEKKGYKKADNAACNLYYFMENLATQYTYCQIDKSEFIKRSKFILGDEIELPKKISRQLKPYKNCVTELKQHRGWKQILINLVAALVTLIVPYAVASLITAATKGRWAVFSASTKSSNQINKIHKAIEAKEDSSPKKT